MPSRYKNRHGCIFRQPLTAWNPLGFGPFAYNVFNFWFTYIVLALVLTWATPKVSVVIASRHCCVHVLVLVAPIAVTHTYSTGCPVSSMIGSVIMKSAKPPIKTRSANPSHLSGTGLSKTISAAKHTSSATIPAKVETKAIINSASTHPGKTQSGPSPDGMKIGKYIIRLLLFCSSSPCRETRRSPRLRIWCKSRQSKARRC